MPSFRTAVITVWAFVPFALFGAACVAANESPAPAGGQIETVSYASCDAVRAAGKAPLHQGDPGYSSSLDRDGDGTACDTKMTFAECQKSAEYDGGRYAVEYADGVCTIQRP